MRTQSLLGSVLLLFFSITTHADELSGSGVPENAYLDGGKSEYAVILCHGRNQHPTWLVVDPLRKGIHDKLGYHTVSIQMPKDDINWRKYDEFFPDAYDRIKATTSALKAKGIKHVYLMGHSMGSRMASAYLANHENHGIKGFIGVGIRNRGGDPLDSAENLESVSIPVVDVYGDGGNAKDADHAEERSHLVSESYKQVFIPDADHKFNDHEDEMVKAVVDWLKTQEK